MCASHDGLQHRDGKGRRPKQHNPHRTLHCTDESQKRNGRHLVLVKFDGWRGARAPAPPGPRRYLRPAAQKQYSQSPPSWLSQAIACVVSLPIRAAAAFSAMQGQPRKAIQLYEQLLSLQPRSRSLLLHLPSNLTRAGLDDAAPTTYEELLSMFPNHLPTLRQFARLAMKRGGDQQARQCFERIIGIVPNDLEAQQGIRNLDALGTIKKGFAA